MPRLRLLIAFLIVLNLFALLAFWGVNSTATAVGEPERLATQLQPDRLTLIPPTQDCNRYAGLTTAQADTLARQLNLQLPNLDVRRLPDRQSGQTALEIRGSLAILEVIARSLARQNILPQGQCAPATPIAASPEKSPRPTE